MGYTADGHRGSHMSSGLKAFLQVPFAGLILVLLCLTGSVKAQETGQADLRIKVDQVGYLPHRSKLAMVTAKGGDFEVKRVTGGMVVFRGELRPSRKDADTGDTVQIADFSALHDSGTYYLAIPGVGRSWPFSISPSVFSRAYYLATRAFYGLRCGTAVDLGPEFTGYSHPACHLKGEFHTSSGKQGERDNVGGWHDAGDYGRYVVNSGIATGTLLWTWEMFGSKLKDIKLNLPEAGNGVPDILNEARWNLEWMLKMQDDDGGVWHKQTSEKFPEFIMPEDDHLPSEVIGTGQAPFKSTCATTDLAAVAAIAARVYRPFDGRFAAQNLEAARTAWLWAEKFPNVTFKNPSGVTTGEYGDESCVDERLWAAAELWRTTGDPTYNDYFVKQYRAVLPSLDTPPAEDWKDVAPMGLWSYALGGREGSDAAVLKEIRDRTVTAAQAIAKRTSQNGYRVSLQAKDYVWGSNGVAASYGMELLVANAFVPDGRLVEAALDNLHYLLGRNAVSISWVTQLGANPCRHPHHRPSGADKNAEPWPGLVCGGPDAARQDPVLKELPQGTPPAKLYADDQASYASNEVAINWQAKLVFLLAVTLP